jgi:hypothetical protein
MFFFQMFNGDRDRGEARPSTRLCLEELESRLTPASVGTYTQAVVQINPNFFLGTATETITATVTNAPVFNPFTGVTTPAGTGTPTGTVLFNLNNQLMSAGLNSSGQATVSFTVPLKTLLTSEHLRIQYLGSGTNPGQSSEFTAPLYTNFDNIIFPATLTFGQLTPQQVQPTVTAGQITALRLDNTAQGMKEDYTLFSFQYTDPGVISNVTFLGITLPGFFASQFGAYAFFTIPG